MSRADDAAQLDLFGPLTEDAETAADGGGATTPPPKAAGGAGATGAAVPGAIPARCPVVGKPVCYYDACHHYQGGTCAHPAAAGRSKPRRRRGKAP